MNVYCGDIERISWQTQAHCAFRVNPNKADIWLIDIEHQLEYLELYGSLLNFEERQRREKYSNESDRHRYEISQGILRILMSKYLNQLPNQILFATHANNKPFLKDHPEIQFNISHSGKLILIGIAKSPIGVDIEKINPSINFFNITADQFSHVELAYVNNSRIPYQTFYKLWTRKEALLKASGLGIDFGMETVPAINGKHELKNIFVGESNEIEINSFKLGYGYMASIAFKPATLNFWKMDALID